MFRSVCCMSSKPTPKKVFSVFKRHYKNVPLEVFGSSAYKTLVSTLLSSRTKDEITLIASKRLFKLAPNVERLKNIKTKKLEGLIYPVGFYKTKAKQLKKLSLLVLINYKGKIPKKRDELMKLPGVGRKTANLVLNRAFGIPAIAVDTHVHKISNLLGWVKTKTPEKTEEELMRILPKKYWSNINRLFVSIGRQHTTKKNLVEFLQNEKLLN